MSIPIKIVNYYQLLLLCIFLILFTQCKSQQSLKLAGIDPSYPSDVIPFSQHPSLTLTQAGVANIRSGLGNAPLFDKELNAARKEIDMHIEKGIDVPIPKDMAGGYTHEVHKSNYKLMHKAGNLYQFTGEDKYAEFVKAMLLEYAKMYPTLGLHPTMKSYATGKIFWQCLNDANWLVFTSQAYDCIYNYLSKKERAHLEKDLFVPFANFLSIDNPKFFNRIHNHSTWANAAVGLMALAMDNDSLLQKALYGMENDGIDPSEMDNDGGFIVNNNIRQKGFLAQLDYSFSPEGYFTEGPYYQRYAILPFLVFGHALHNKRPDLKIFEYRDKILIKATNSLLQLTDPQGNFFAINDAQKGMSYKAYEVVTAVDLVYMVDSTQDNLLEWAGLQDNVAFNESGFAIAKKLNTFQPNIPVKKSEFYGDGVNGDKGGISVIRLKNTDLLFKFSSHGMGHGHFDRLSYSLYDKSGEVLQDYGAVRWVNIDQKAGGRYLPENKTFGKQTIAHNTLVVNQKSQFGASIKKAEKVNPILNYSDFNKDNIKIISASENNAYSGVDQQRTIILYSDPSFTEPLLIDIFKVNSKEPATMELPFWYSGHFMDINSDCLKNIDGLKPLGERYGYQHIWKESDCIVSDTNIKFNWFGNSKFYTLNSTSQAGDRAIHGRAGANDPKFNLRSDPVFIHRKENTTEAIFFNIVESHGTYSTITEIPLNPYSTIHNLKVLEIDKDYTSCTFTSGEFTWTILLAQSDYDSNKNHEFYIDNIKHQWQGPYTIIKSKN